MQPYVGEAKKLKNFLTTLEIFKNILVRWWGGGAHLCPISGPRFYLDLFLNLNFWIFSCVPIEEAAPSLYGLSFTFFGVWTFLFFLIWKFIATLNHLAIETILPLREVFYPPVPIIS